MNKHITSLKDLMANEELAQYIAEDISDFSEDTEVTYELWAIGYTKKDELTDSELFMGTFNDPDEAVAVAEKLTLGDIVQQASGEVDDPESADSVDYLLIEVETVIEDPEEEGTINIGTIYRREIWINPEDLRLENSDYEPLEDGTIKISCSLLKDFNIKDKFTVRFVETNDGAALISYQIVSKVEYPDGDYYICDFVY